MTRKSHHKVNFVVILELSISEANVDEKSFKSAPKMEISTSTIRWQLDKLSAEED